MLKSSVSFIDRMVELLPYKTDVLGSILGDGTNYFRLFLKLKTKSSQILSNNPRYYVCVMDNVLSLTICQLSHSVI